VEKLGLEGEPPFPIFLRLSRFAEFLMAHPDGSCGDEAPEHLLRYLDNLLKGHAYGLPADFLRRRVESGGCLFLLDGLDEVAGPMRLRLAAVVERVVIEGARANRHLFTCRTRAYAGPARLATSPSFQRLMIRSRDLTRRRWAFGFDRGIHQNASRCDS
jgi:hypothetical protein